MSVEEQLRRALADRAAALDGAAPDGRDLARRIRRAQRATQRAQRAVLVAALVVIAGSSGAVLGAFAVRPAGGGSAQPPPNQTVGTDFSPTTTPSTLPVTGSTTPATSTTSTTSPSASAATTTTTGPTGAAGQTGGTGNTGAPVSASGPVHQATLDGLQVNWLTTPLNSSVTVVSPGSSSACMAARVVTMSVGGESPLAGGSGVLGLPALAPAGIAVVASGAFGSVGHPGGWWAIVETGSAATSVAVQFPSGATVREPVVNGAAVLAVLAPTGATVGAYSGYASAVADGSSGVTSSLEFIVGGAPATVDAMSGSAPHGMGAGSCLPASAIGVGTPTTSSGRAHHLGGGNSSGNSGNGQQAGGGAKPTGPPSPVTDAGEVVAAFEQAYDLDPLLGLDWSFSAVDLSPTSGCSLSDLGSVTTAGVAGSYKLLPPAVAVDAVAFVSPERAVVIYHRGAGLRESGTAVLSDGSWKVGGATYCADMAPAVSVPTPAP